MSRWGVFIDLVQASVAIAGLVPENDRTRAINATLDRILKAKREHAIEADIAEAVRPPRRRTL